MSITVTWFPHIWADSQCEGEIYALWAAETRHKGHRGWLCDGVFYIVSLKAWGAGCRGKWAVTTLKSGDACQRLSPLKLHAFPGTMSARPSDSQPSAPELREQPADMLRSTQQSVEPPFIWPSTVVFEQDLNTVRYRPRPGPFHKTKVVGDMNPAPGIKKDSSSGHDLCCLSLDFGVSLLQHFIWKSKTSWVEAEASSFFFLQHRSQSCRPFTDFCFPTSRYQLFTVQSTQPLLRDATSTWAGPLRSSEVLVTPLACNTNQGAPYCTWQ